MRKLLLLLPLVLLLGHDYRPARWKDRPQEISVLNPPMIYESILAVHAIRWREYTYKSVTHAASTKTPPSPPSRGGLGGGSGVEIASADTWEIIVELANVSVFETATIRVRVRDVERTFTIEKGKPVWWTVHVRLPVPVKAAAKKDDRPASGKEGRDPPRPARPTSITKPVRHNAKPRLQDLRFEVVSVEPFP